MNSKLLLPHKFKPVGWVLLLVSITVILVLYVLPTKSNPTCKQIASYTFNFTKKDMSTDEALATLMIVGALFVGFSKERTEDEGIASLRLRSLLWAVFLNYAFMAIALLFFDEFTFLKTVLYNIYSVLLLFIIIFNTLRYLHSRIK